MLKKKQKTFEEDQHIDGDKRLIPVNVTISGRRTSVRLEKEMWQALHEIAKREQCTIHDVCTLISLRKKRFSSLTSSIRVFVVLYFKAASTENGHEKAGHGGLMGYNARK